MINPPKLAVRLFEWYCKGAMVEDLLGDMDEIFYQNIAKMPVWRAKLSYWVMMIELLASYSLKKRKRDSSFHVLSNSQNTTAMIRNYFKVAYRSLARNKFFTLINVLGLAFGMSITILYLGFMNSLMRYDKFHENYDKLYRIVSTVDQRTEVYDLASSPAPIGDAIEEQHHGFNDYVKINKGLYGEAQYEQKSIPLEGYYTQPGFFDLFTFKLVKGDAKTALAGPFQMILTESAAYKLFGDLDPVGKVVSYEDKGDYVVSGIVADPPKGSHLIFDVLASYSTLPILERDKKISKISDEWVRYQDNYTYLLLEDEQVPDVARFLHQLSSNKYKDTNEIKASFMLQPMSKIVLGWTNYHNDIGPYFGGPPVIGFGVLTLLILLPACFNYSNISISRAMNRAKEIGIRKVVGGSKKQIWLQFIVESILIALLALIGSVVIFSLIKDGFADMLAQGGTVDFTFSFSMLLVFIGFAVVAGFFAGIGPASYFSRIKPVTALTGTKGLKIFGKTSFKKVLIVAQFSISLFFIIGVLVQLKQTRYSLNYNMGFNRENLLNVDLQNVDKDIFRNEFSKNASVTQVSMSSGIIGIDYLPDEYIRYNDKIDSLEFKGLSIDHNYIDNLDLKLVAGTNFSDVSAEKSEFIIVNETFSKNAGYETPHDAVGKAFIIDGKEVTIQGVVQDFNYNLLRTPIRNFVFRHDPSAFRFANLKVSASDHFVLISHLEDTWKQLDQDQKFKSSFFDKDLEEAFKNSSQMLKLYGFMGLMAIIVGCLGLLGMVVYNAETRKKEVGVRKVMGATLNQILYLLSKEYIKLMIIAALIAIPVSYFIFNLLLAMEQHYSVTVGFMEIVLGLLILFLLGAITMLSQTYKTANTNPANTLKYE